MQLEPLPISLARLERYRIAARYQKRPGLVGGHQMRRKGQSLEFYDYRPFIPGDDIRHVDWRASARHGSAEDLLLRTYTAEEQLTLIISLDLRETMKMPGIMPKTLIAAWLSEALAWIAIRSGERVILHRLFGKSSAGLQEIRGTGNTGEIRKVLNRFYTYKDKQDNLNLGILERYLKPAVVWIIISDFYFPMERAGKRLSNRIAEAQAGMRWIILVDTDSWPYEKHYLGQGPRKIQGPGLPAPEQPLDIESETLLQVENRIQEHKRQFQARIDRSGSDLSNWKWPGSETLNPGVFFEEQFGGDRVLKRLFMRDTAM